MEIVKDPISVIKGGIHVLVEDTMRTDIQKLQPDNTIKDAVELMEKAQIRHIPVVEKDDELVGIISDRDVRDARSSIFSEERLPDALENPISAIMKREVFTAHPLDFVEDVASMLSEKQISAAPITVNNKLVGMITGRDLLDTLVKLTGADQPSTQLEIRVTNVSGQLADVAAIFKNLGVNVTSVLAYPEKNPTNIILTFRVQTMDPRAVIAKLKEEGYELVSPSIPGMGI